MTRLGRGLNALIGDAEPGTEAAADRSRQTTRQVPIDALVPNPFQPRQTFVEADLSELTESIREKGIIQPIVVRPIAGQVGRFQIVAGERRWRAAQRAQLHDVPIVVKDLSDAEALEVAIIENVQRADLNAIEESQGYAQLIEQFRYTQEQLSQYIGKSRSHIANTLRLMNLPTAVRAMIADGRLSAGHARTLVTARDPEALAREIIAKGLSVRQAEAHARVALGRPAAGRNKANGKPATVKDADTRQVEMQIAEALGLSVSIDGKGEAGEVRIKYTTLEQLDDVVRRLTQG